MSGFGSSIAIERGSWKGKRDGTFTGVLIAHPDRGFNVSVSLFRPFVHLSLTSMIAPQLEYREHTINYQARRHEIKFEFTPYYGSASLDYSLTYHKTTLLTERLNKKTSGLDPAAL